VIDNSPAPSRLVNADALPNRVFPAQPSRTQNVSVTFIDRIVNLDAEGKALDPVRIATLTIPAKMKGSETRGTILFCAYVSDRAVPGPYGVSVHASANMERKVRIDPAGTATVEESWEFRSQDGDSIQLQMQYVRGPSTPGKAEAKLYSAVKPEFYRIYRSEQSTDVVRSATADRVQKVQFKASSEALAAVRRLGATDRRHLEPVVYAADFPACIVVPRTGLFGAARSTHLVTGLHSLSHRAISLLHVEERAQHRKGGTSARSHRGRPSEYAVNLGGHDEVVLMQSLDLLGL
jgi:hypothetical protein